MSQLVVQTPVKSADAAAAPQSDRAALLGSLKPLVVDVVVPMASYYVLSKGFGMSTLAALGWSSVPPALRTVWGCCGIGGSMCWPESSSSSTWWGCC